MKTISQVVEKTLSEKPVKDEQKLKQQQAYYHRLQKQGIAKKQTYNLKSISAL